MAATGATTNADGYSVMAAGDSLSEGQSLVSANGAYKATLGENGAITVTSADGATLYSYNPSPSNKVYLSNPTLSMTSTGLTENALVRPAQSHIPAEYGSVDVPFAGGKGDEFKLDSMGDLIVQNSTGQTVWSSNPKATTWSLPYPSNASSYLKSNIDSINIQLSLMQGQFGYDASNVTLPDTNTLASLLTDQSVVGMAEQSAQSGLSGEAYAYAKAAISMADSELIQAQSAISVGTRDAAKTISEYENKIIGTISATTAAFRHTTVAPNLPTTYYVESSLLNQANATLAHVTTLVNQTAAALHSIGNNVDSTVKAHLWNFDKDLASFGG
jgi:hypothetical protein